MSVSFEKRDPRDVPIPGRSPDAYPGVDLRPGRQVRALRSESGHSKPISVGQPVTSKKMSTHPEHVTVSLTQPQCPPSKIPDLVEGARRWRCPLPRSCRQKGSVPPSPPKFADIRGSTASPPEGSTASPPEGSTASPPEGSTASPLEEGGDAAPSFVSPETPISVGSASDIHRRPHAWR